jgi:hypothetical protein
MSTTATPAADPGLPNSVETIPEGGIVALFGRWHSVRRRVDTLPLKEGPERTIVVDQLMGEMQAIEDQLLSILVVTARDLACKIMVETCLGDFAIDTKGDVFRELLSLTGVANTDQGRAV